MNQAKTTAESSATPIWLIVLFALSVYWGMMYLDKHAGGFDPGLYEPYASSPNLIPPPPEPTNGPGKKIYNRTCVACHQANGLGTLGQFPPLAGSEWVTAPSPNRIIRIVLNGASGRITVKGMDYNNAMVPWKDALSDAEIAAVLSYVRQEWGNKSPEVTPEQVKAIRKKLENQSGPMVPDELLRLSEGE